jgi:sugar porter (SP) family MFS transporter
VAVAAIGAIGGFLFGFNMHIITGAVIFVRQEFRLSPSQLGFAVSCATLGCMAGAVTAASLADRLGRKKALAVTALVFIVGTVGTVISGSALQFDAFRILSGLGVGVVSVVSPMYMAEISPARLRGRLVTINQLTIVTAGFLSIVVAYYLTREGNWRAMFAAALIPVLALLVVLPFVPESPRWLIEQGAPEAARKVLTRVYRIEATVVREMNEISASFTLQKTGRLAELFRPGARKALVIGIVLAMAVQLTGTSPLSWYVPIIFQKAGFRSANDAMFQTVILNGWLLLCSIGAMSIVDRLGRRPLLLIGTCGMALTMAAIGCFFYGATPGIYVLITILLALGLFNFSLAPLFWLLISEIYPTTLRAKGMAVASLTQWLCAFLAAQTFPMLVAYSEQRFNTIAPLFWMFAAVCAASALFCYAMVPETRNRSLEQITNSLDRKSDHASADATSPVLASRSGE